MILKFIGKGKEPRRAADVEGKAQSQGTVTLRHWDLLYSYSNRDHSALVKNTGRQINGTEQRAQK